MAERSNETAGRQRVVRLVGLRHDLFIRLTRAADARATSVDTIIDEILDAEFSSEKKK